MKKQQRSYLSIAAAALLCVYLMIVSLTLPGGFGLSFLWLLFLLLILYTTTFGVPLGGGSVSLLPMSTLAAILVLGWMPAAWVAFIGALVHGWVRQQFAMDLEERPQTTWLEALGLGAVNAFIQALSVMISGWVYTQLGGPVPLTGINSDNILSLLAMAVVYLGMNYLLAGLYIRISNPEAFQVYHRSLPALIRHEGFPLIFTPLLALIGIRMGAIGFVLAALSIMSTSLIMRRLTQTSERLKRRVDELDSLQVVGQALSSSLNLETLLATIYTQVNRLMPSTNFYVAFWVADLEEISFPYVIHDGARIRWINRKMGNGLTEYVLRHKQPLLIEKDFESRIREMGLEPVGSLAKCWLGAPLMAGSETLGIIAVQSYTNPEAYDRSHQEILTTIASQASIAVQNARLYAKTDAALTRRVQELDSILRTASEGMLLLDLNWRVLAANAALARFLGVPRGELEGAQLTSTGAEEAAPSIRLLGFDEESFRCACQMLSSGDQEIQKSSIVLPGPIPRNVERSLTRVLDREGAVSGWLLVFRDTSEEVQLARLREEMMHMLIHDLRSPLATLASSLAMLDTSLHEGPDDDVDDLLDLAQRGSERMLDLVNELLEINRLESGQAPLKKSPVLVTNLLDETARQFSPLAQEAEINVEVEYTEALPEVCLDKQQINRVLSNLVDNAIKFTPNGGQIRLWAQAEPPEKPTSILIGVSDTGPGIPKEARVRIFEKFQRVTTIKGRRLGTGLGLAFCKLSVETHGGEIWVDSQNGHGSNFVFRLPLS